MNIIAELSGFTLDYWVAQVEGKNKIRIEYIADERIVYAGLHWYQPTKDWAVGGPIIARESISIICNRSPKEESWRAFKENSDNYYGKTPLVAAMRCLVASKLCLLDRSDRNTTIASSHSNSTID